MQIMSISVFWAQNAQIWNSRPRPLNFKKFTCFFKFSEKFYQYAPNKHSTTLETSFKLKLYPCLCFWALSPPFPIVKSKRGLRFSKFIKWMSLLDLPSSNVHTLKILLNQRAWLCIFGLQAYLHGIVCILLN